MPTPFNAERPNSAWRLIWGGACFEEVNHTIAFAQNAPRGLSATAEFLVNIYINYA